MIGSTGFGYLLPLAIPTLYWMLECTGCHCRFVVHDCYLVLVPTSNSNLLIPNEYSGPPLPLRYSCVRGCTDRLQTVGSISRPDGDNMSLIDPRIPVSMSDAMCEEWQYLSQDRRRWVETPFPREAILADYARRHPVLTMTDHDGTRQKDPPVEAALKWLDVMEPGQSLSFARRDGGTLDIRREDTTYSARLADSPREPVDVSGLSVNTVDWVIERYIADAETNNTRKSLIRGAKSSPGSRSWWRRLANM